MSSKAMSLKGKIRHYAQKNKIAAQVVLQNYMFERFLARLERSAYYDRFVIKGGMLVAALVGLDTRSTMDMDATLRNLPLEEGQIRQVVEQISAVPLEDDVVFVFRSLAPIRKDDRYGGFCVRLDAIYDTIVTPLSIDISTGDIMTPAPVPYELTGLFDESVKIHLWGYNVETVLAEKAETILSRGIFNTRPRDFYDIYILSKTQSYDTSLFLEALHATAAHRGSSGIIAAPSAVLAQISTSDDLQKMWAKYQRTFPYAKDISYQETVVALKRLLHLEGGTS